jgi:hypothetical protein
MVVLGVDTPAVAAGGSTLLEELLSRLAFNGLKWERVK